jgi:hypothetical protein
MAVAFQIFVAPGFSLARARSRVMVNLWISAVKQQERQQQVDASEVGQIAPAFASSRKPK